MSPGDTCQWALGLAMGVDRVGLLPILINSNIFTTTFNTKNEHVYKLHSAYNYDFDLNH